MLQVLSRLAPGMIALVLAWRMRQVQRRFLEAGVVRPDRAVPLDSLGVRGFGLVFRILTRHGVLVRADQGYYLDVAARQRWIKRRRTIAAIMAVIVAGALLWTMLRT